MADLQGRLREGRTRLVWVEAPGSTSMEVCDIPAISRLCKTAGAFLGCDNTWATGLLCKPLELGVDIVAEALTKYVGGHSDILLGAIILRDMELYGRVRNALGCLGVGVSPDECSLALRGLQTLGLRLRHVGAISEEFAHRLTGSGSFTVLHPVIAEASGHDLWRRDFKGSSGVFSLRLEECPRRPLTVPWIGCRRSQSALHGAERGVSSCRSFWLIVMSCHAVTRQPICELALVWKTQITSGRIWNKWSFHCNRSSNCLTHSHTALQIQLCLAGGIAVGERLS
nr:PLP-dependent transferase [Rhizobium sp. 007]